MVNVTWVPGLPGLSPFGLRDTEFFFILTSEGLSSHMSSDPRMLSKAESVIWDHMNFNWNLRSLPELCNQDPILFGLKTLFTQPWHTHHSTHLQMGVQPTAAT